MAEKTTGNEVGVKRSVLRVLILSIITFGIYGFFWFYTYRNLVSKHLGTQDNAGLQTVGLIVPILNLFIIYWLWRDIDKLQKKAGLPGFSAGGYLAVVVAAMLLGWIPIFGWALVVAEIVIYFLVLTKLNQYFDKQSGGKATEAKFTGGEIVVTLIGVGLAALLLVTGVIGTLVGQDQVNEDQQLEQLQDELDKIDTDY